MELVDKYVMNTYTRAKVCFVRGEGSRLWDEEGREYVDFLSGIGVCALGHANPKVAQAACNQMLKLVHTSNLFYIAPQAELARLLVENTFAEKVFFCNSGTEANEGAVKIARAWGQKHLKGAHVVLTAYGSFHGRTLAMMSATGQGKIRAGFGPAVPGFRHVPFGNPNALEAEILLGDVCAVMLEPIQGEGGVVVPPESYLKEVREICDRHGLLLILDEVQSGMGRTGKLLAHEHFGVRPDVVTIAKALANGLPAGAILATQEAAAMLGPGMHASTFGGGPVVMSAAITVIEELLSPGFLEEVAEKGRYFMDKLSAMAQEVNDKAGKEICREVRGKGLMVGVELTIDGAVVVEKMLEKGFVINCTQGNVLRFLPPLVIENQDIDAMVAALTTVLGGL